MIILSLPISCIILQLLCQNQAAAQNSRHANNVFEVECYDQSDCSTPGWVCHNYYCRPPSCGPCERLNRNGKCKSICDRGQQCIKDKCVTIKKKNDDCQQNSDCAPGNVCVYYKCVSKDYNICDKCSIYNGKYCELACTKGGEYCNPEVGCVCEYGLIRNSSGLCSPKNPEEYKPDDIPVPVVPKHKIPEYPVPPKHTDQYPEPNSNQYPEPNANQYPEPNTNQYPEPNTNQYPEPSTNQYPPENPTVQYPPEPTQRYPPEPPTNQYPEPTVQYPPEPPTNQYPEPTVQYPEPVAPTPPGPPHGVPPECYFDDHCTPGYKCLENECIPECLNDEHCFPGKKCIQYRCECSDDEHCGASHYCSRKDSRCYESKANTKPSPPKKQKPKPTKQCPVCEALDQSGRCVYQCDYHGYEVCDDVKTKQCICRPGYTRNPKGKCERERRRPRKNRPRDKKPRKQTKQTRPKRPERKQRPRPRQNNKIDWKRNIKIVWEQKSGEKPRRDLNALGNDLWTIPELKI